MFNELDLRLQKLVLKRRHLDQCQQKHGIKEWDQLQDKRKRCACPYWVLGVLFDNEGFQRKATRANTEDAARAVVRHWLIQNGTTTRPEDARHTPLHRAIDGFMQYTKDGGAKESSLGKYKTLMDQVQAFSDWKGVRFVQELNEDLVDEFRRSWDDCEAGYKKGQLDARGRRRWTRVCEGTARRQAKTLRSFFQFCIVRKWMAGNPTAALRFAKQTTVGRKKHQVKYLTGDQMTDIVWAVGKCERMPLENRKRLEGLILLMRHTGLRLSDAVALSIDKIQGDVLKLETQKSSTDVQIPLPPEVMRVVRELKPYDGGLLFWNRQSEASNLRTPVLNYTNALQKVFTIAGVKVKGDGKLSHMFRNTFAVSLLEKGVPLETVSLLLGHRSVTTTERYYADFSKEYMNRAEATVRATWNLQPGETLTLARSGVPTRLQQHT